MSKKPSARQAERNKQFKEATGSSPNGVANSWFASRRGKDIAICSATNAIKAKLIAFDAYSIQVEINGVSSLILKGPGLQFADPEALG